MNLIRLSKNILTATALVLMATGLSSCYFRLSDDAKKHLKNELRRYHEGEADTVTYNPGKFHSVRSEDGEPNVGTLSVTSTGSGDTTLSGKAGSVTLDKSGSGDMDASGLKAKNVTTQEN